MAESLGPDVLPEHATCRAKILRIGCCRVCWVVMTYMIRIRFVYSSTATVTLNQKFSKETDVKGVWAT